ncbi:MAG: acyl-CoA ligase (AMP-forming) (exosortase A-associated) [Alteromonadaceae bacterium]|jgi:acyl-CoA ligase (AMP-forming) (exosortase A-associated)
MPILLHDLLLLQATKSPNHKAIAHKNNQLNYIDLANACIQAAGALNALSLNKGDRVAVYLPKNFEAVISYFAISYAGGIIVPVNPTFKTVQVVHILQDCQAKILITNTARFAILSKEELTAVHHVILIDDTTYHLSDTKVWHWNDFINLDTHGQYPAEIIDTDIAVIFYTSGSTGNAKGVVLSHKNIVTGAKSVHAYLPCKRSDNMLAVLPFSFDYGFSQLTIAFLTGASCYLTEFIFIDDLMKTIKQQDITCLALVPPLWIKLANSQWPAGLGKQIRYFCNTGGCMPMATLTILRKKMPYALPYMMYGLTEAFRSCYLPPTEIDKRPTSFGKAIPNVQIMVINDQGEECQPFESGELVHCGSLVSQGYWNDTEKTKERFRPIPNALKGSPITEVAVWSGDIVTKDEEGYLYFVSRKDDMIKTSGYRVSPQEIEDVLYQLDQLSEVVVIGVPHDELGQAIIAIVVTKALVPSERDILKHCLKHLPNFMVPHHIVYTLLLPRNCNNKFDRNHWRNKYQNHFSIK